VSARAVPRSQRCLRTGPAGCAPGGVLNSRGDCVVVPPPAGCPRGEVLSRRGDCVASPLPAGCPRGEVLGRRGKCVPIGSTGRRGEHGGPSGPPPRLGPLRPHGPLVPHRPILRSSPGGRGGWLRR
jgi:hypothetical protein